MNLAGGAAGKAGKPPRRRRKPRPRAARGIDCARVVRYYTATQTVCVRGEALLHLTCTLIFLIAK